MKKPIFYGSGVAVCTPFNDDNSVDFVSYQKLIEFQIANGTKALIVLGTTGENPTATDAEFEKIVSFAVKTVSKRIPVIVGTGRNDTAHSVALSIKAHRLGADALLVVSPYYNKTTQDGLVAHITAVASATDLPIILYNVPSRTGMSFTHQTYAKLAKLPTVNGVKEAGSDFTLLLRTLHACPKDFYIYCGNDDQITAMMALGAVGVVSVLANVAPKQTQDICAYALNKDFEKSAALQTELCDLIDALFTECNPIPAKAALTAMGLCKNNLRLPLVPISADNKKILISSLKRHGII